MHSTDPIDIASLLAAPFPAAEVRWKPQAVKGNRCMVIAYIDARNVMDRLDDVVGVDGWQDEYKVLPDGSAECTLSLYLGGGWVAKSDVGSQSDQPDDGDKMKAAYSDALKRAATKFGVGRYLYRLPKQWVEYDQNTKRPTRTPTLPDWAIPAAKGPAAAPAKKPPEKAQNGPATGIPAATYSEIKKTIEACPTVAALKTVWEQLDKKPWAKAQQDELAAVKDRRKAALTRPVEKELAKDEVPV